MMESLPFAYFSRQVEEDPNIIGTYTDDDGDTVVLVLDDTPTRMEAHALYQDGVKVIKTAPFVAYQIPTGKFRPAPAGVSCGSYRITAGTLGLWVKDKSDGSWQLLSNNHVLANVDQCKVGDDIVQPGIADGGVRLGDTVADLTRWVPLTNSGVHNVDCAIAKLKHDGDARLDILNIGYCYGVVEPFLDQKIWKQGRTSGLTRGRITAVDARIQVNYGPSGDIVLDDCIVSSIPSQPGDSGSSLLDFASNRIVGLLFAGNGYLTIGCKASNVFSQLNIETIEPPEITRSLWLDLSHWQKPINNLGESYDNNFKANVAGLTPQSFSQMKTAGVRGVILKICEGANIVDPEFAGYYDHAKQAGLLVSGYIFMRGNVSAPAHQDNFIRAIGDRKLDTPPWMDCETKDGASPAELTSLYQNFATMLSVWYGSANGVYTGVWFWDTNVLRWSGWKYLPLWIAYWSDTAITPNVPADWKDVSGQPYIWQYDVSENGPALGVSSQQVDTNVTFPSFETLLGDVEPPPPPPETVALTITVEGQGWVSPGSGQYAKDETIQLTATPENGWKFSGWYGDMISQANPLNLLMDADKAVTATFTESGQSGPKEFIHNKGVTKVTLNYRNGPGTKYAKIGSITSGTTVEILETAKEGNNVWARIGFKQWACQNFGGVMYIEYVME